MSKRSAVYVIDDEPEVGRSLLLLLATADVVAQSFSSGDEFLAAESALPPGIIVSDMMMPGVNGMELLKSLKARGRIDPVIIIAGHADVPMAVKALQAGAIDLIEKPFEPETILAAIAAARRRTDELDGAQSALSGLSRRERQVLELIIAGLTNKEAALALSISPRTVETYRANLMAKTGADSISMLVRIGVSAGLGQSLKMTPTTANGAYR